MLYDNYAMQTKREILARMVRLMKEGKLMSDVRKIPVEMRPRGKRNGGCCVHKDRYIIKHKIISILGFDIKDEDIDLNSMEHYVKRSLENKNVKENILSVVHEACSACVQSQYFITNMCRGCEARACQMNCPRKAVNFKGGKAVINQDDCIGCGLCKKVCPYHAVVYTPVPCEEACPVKAIVKQEDGTEHILKDKCIYCGRCMQACPYGAIMERSKIVDVHKGIANPEQRIVAIVAPAIYGQYNATPGQVLQAIRNIGFDEVIEVALGAEETSRHESAEFKERMEAGQPMMTTSCCPSYVRWVENHAPAMKPFVSDARSPMVYAARIAKQRYPDAEVVFIGPCLAKRHEGDLVEEVDYILSFEELAAFMAAYEIDPTTCAEMPLEVGISGSSRGYARAGGVREAIREAVGTGYTMVNIEGLDKKNIGLLRGMVKKPTAQFVEVMACEGGCINGPCSLIPLAKAKQHMVQNLE